MELSTIIIGAGGCGRNILEKLQAQQATTARHMLVNTDQRSLDESTINCKVHLDRLEPDYITRSVDMGASPNVILTAGLGGATGMAVILALAEWARHEGKNVSVVVTMPFSFEGEHRMRKAKEAIARLRQVCQQVIALNNDDYMTKEFVDGPASRLIDHVNSLAGIALCSFVSDTNAETDDEGPSFS